MTQITKIIFDQIAAFDLPPREINNGSCMTFAEAVVEELVRRGEHGAMAVDVEWFDENWDQDYAPWHAWIYLNGRWYDAEVPEGVDDWEELPFWKLWAVDGFIPKRQPDEAQRVAASADLYRRVHASIAEELK